MAQWLPVIALGGCDAEAGYSWGNTNLIDDDNNNYISTNVYLLLVPPPPVS